MKCYYVSGESRCNGCYALIDECRWIIWKLLLPNIEKMDFCTDFCHFLLEKP